VPSRHPERARLKGCGWLGDAVGAGRALGLRSRGAGAPGACSSHTPPSPQADPIGFNAQERKNSAADGVLDTLSMEIRLPLLLFAACGNCAEPQRWEPKRVSCIIPPASLAGGLSADPRAPNRNSAPAAPGRGLCSGDVRPRARQPSGFGPWPWGCWPGAHPCLLPRFTVQ